MNVVIYARYSSHNQTEQSIEGQIAVCEEYAKRNNYTIVGEYIDRALTGTNDNRPQFLKMIEDSNKKYFNGVLVYQLDRFARNRYDSATYKNKLKKNNVRVFSAKENISDDASGVLMESVLEGMAEYYSVELSQKVKRGMKINAEKFLFNGGFIPLGLKVDENKKYQIDNDTAPIIKQVFNMYLGGKTMKEISIYLNTRGIKTALGNSFTKSSINGILSNKKYIGIYSYNGIETPNVLPQIIDNETFNKVQEILNKNKQNPASAKAKTEYILTTKLFCGHCQEMLIGISGTSATKKSYYYYSCNGTRKNICNKKNIQKDYIENVVVNETRNILTDERIQEIAREFVKYVNKHNNTTETDRLKGLIQRSKKEKQNLIDSLKLFSDYGAKQSVVEEIEKIENNIRQLEHEMNFEASQNINITVEEVEFFLTEIRNGDINDLRYRKLLVNTLINKIYLYDDDITFVYNIKQNQKNIKLPTIEEIESSFSDSSGQPNLYRYSYPSCSDFLCSPIGLQ